MPTHFWINLDRSWSRIHIDFAKPERGVCFLVAVDGFSNWAYVEVRPPPSSLVVAEKLRRLFLSYAVPDLVESDNGTAFVSQETHECLELSDIHSMYTSP